MLNVIINESEIKEIYDDLKFEEFTNKIFNAPYSNNKRSLEEIKKHCSVPFTLGKKLCNISKGTIKYIDDAKYSYYIDSKYFEKFVILSCNQTEKIRKYQTQTWHNLNKILLYKKQSNVYLIFKEIYINKKRNKNV